MNRKALRRLFILAIAAGAGLLALQMFWMHNEWQNTAGILQRQVDYAFQTSVDSELAKRKDILKGYLEKILTDTSFVNFGTRYNEREGKWMITMYDAHNKKDYSAWTNADMPVGPELTPQQKTAIIHNYVQKNVSKNIEEDVIFFYTQRFGDLWTDKFKHLALDSLYLQKVFARQLTLNDIKAGFNILYIDTAAKPLQLGAKGNAFVTKPVSINYATVNDYRQKYIAAAYVYNPFGLLLKRLWLALFATLLLLALTFYCLYRMYKTILQQKQLNELKNDFISNMTHELKTPIATVTAAVDGLQYFEGLEDRQKAERYLNTSRSQLQRLNEIVQKVLDTAIYERQLITLHKEEIGIKTMFENIIQSFEVKGNVFGYEINCIPGNITVTADKMHLANVLYNLVDNAVKYVPANLHLVFDAYRQGGNAIITVTDNGPGVDEKHLPHLFEKFYRVPHGDIQNVKGFGLGLFYVQQIIALHGGAVRAKSRTGMQFIIELPE